MVDLHRRSRGTVILALNGPISLALIDPAYNTTEADRYVMHISPGLKKMLEVTKDRNEGQAIVEK